MDTWYHYDLEAPEVYRTRNNRLMYHEAFDVTAPGNPVLLERVDYDYADRLAPGNVTRITRRPAGAALVQATDLTYGRNGQLWLVTERSWEEQVLWEGDCALDFNGASAAGCCAETVYDVPVPDGACCVVSTAEPCRSGYASQHYQQVAVDNAQVLSITEFRGQGRARTLVRQRDPLGPSEVLPETAIWHDYDGDEIYGDYLADAAGVATDSASFELGLAQASTGQVAYFQGDQIGSTRQMSDQDAVLVREQVTTAFGEVVFSAGSTDTRYQYAGAHGYENLEIAALHVGHRYYEPALGRFLQRDPIGIRGGTNVYQYVGANPLIFVDPDGLDVMVGIAKGVIWITGGEKSWLDNPNTVKNVQRIARDVAIEATLTACGVGLLSHAAKLRHLRWLNTNRYLRIGSSRVPGGKWARRIAIGGGKGRKHILITRPRPILPGGIPR